jgi:hypothetical protein
MNLEQLYRAVLNLPESHENRDLEEYLLAVYGNVLKHRDSKPTLELVLRMLCDSFPSEPVRFEPEWLNITEAPDRNRMSRKFTNPEISSEVDKANLSGFHGIDFTIETLKFQIAELHKMKDKQLKNELRYFGLRSETGNYWFNFDPFTNLECGVRCMLDNQVDIDEIDWSFIGDLLENGRVYE